MRRGYVDLKIVYETMDVETHRTSAKYDMTVLLANIGGQFGLFTGFSFLTALEIFELVFDILATTITCKICCMLLKRK